MQIKLPSVIIAEINYIKEQHKLTPNVIESYTAFIYYLYIHKEIEISKKYVRKIINSKLERYENLFNSIYTSDKIKFFITKQSPKYYKDPNRKYISKSFKYSLNVPFKYSDLIELYSGGELIEIEINDRFQKLIHKTYKIQKNGTLEKNVYSNNFGCVKAVMINSYNELLLDAPEQIKEVESHMRVYQTDFTNCRKIKRKYLYKDITEILEIDITASHSRFIFQFIYDMMHVNGIKKYMNLLYYEEEKEEEKDKEKRDRAVRDLKTIYKYMKKQDATKIKEFIERVVNVDINTYYSDRLKMTRDAFKKSNMLMITFYNDVVKGKVADIMKNEDKDVLRMFKYVRKIIDNSSFSLFIMNIEADYMRRVINECNDTIDDFCCTYLHDAISVRKTVKNQVKKVMDEIWYYMNSIVKLKCKEKDILKANPSECQ